MAKICPDCRYPLTECICEDDEQPEPWRKVPFQQPDIPDDAA